MGDAPDETVSYRYETDRDRWNDWKDTVPRSIPLDSRLDSLIAADAAGLLDLPDKTAASDIDEEDARRGIIQIRRHAMRASQQLGDDESSCRDELETIINVAGRDAEPKAAPEDEPIADGQEGLTRILFHALRAQQFLGDDEDTCREQIRTIKRVADDVL